MQLKKLIPACLALVMLCGCSSNNSSTSSKKDNNKSSDTVTEKVDAKDLTTVKGTMSVPEGLTAVALNESTIEYTVDKNGLIHTINFHQVTGETPYDDDKMYDSKGKDVYYLDDSKIPEWKSEKEKEAKIDKKGYSVSLSIGDKLSEEETLNLNGEKVSYKATYDYKLNDNASNKSIKDFSDTFGLITKNGKITEKSLKKYLEDYFMTYTN